MKNFATLCLIAFLSTFYSCQNSQIAVVNQTPKTPEQLKEELRALEIQNPGNYLVTSNEKMVINKILVKKETLFHLAKYDYDGWIISGVVSNSATMAKFKDIVLNVKLISQTESLIEEKNYVVYDYYEPNSTKPFAIKIAAPEPTHTFQVSVVSATAVR